MTGAPPSPPRDPAYGWVIVAASTVLMGLSFGGLSSSAVFMKPLIAEFQWSRADIAMAYTVGAVAAALGGLLFGQIADRWPPRPVVCIGAAIMGVVLMSLSQMSSLTHFYLAVAIFGAVGVAACSITMNTTVSLWFIHRRGLAIGVAGAGAALGQGLVPFAAQILISAGTWRDAYLYLGIGYLVIGLGFALAVRRSPLSAAAIDSLDEAASGSRPLRPAEGFAWLSVAPVFCCICMAVPIMHIAPLVSDRGFSAQQAATVMAVVMIAGALGRILAGRLADRIGAFNTYLVVGTIQTVMAYWFILAQELWHYYAVAILFGMGYAGVMTCLLVTTRTLIPARLTGTGMSITSLAGWTGMGLGAYMGGVLFDVNQSYALSYAAAAFAGSINILLIVALSLRWRRKRRTLVAQPA